MMNWIDIIDRAFSLYRGYFRCFFGTIVICTGVFVLRECVLFLCWKYKAYHIFDDILYDLLLTLEIGLLIIIAGEVHYDRQITLREVFHRFTSCFSRYCGSTLLYLMFLTYWTRFIGMYEPSDPSLSFFILLSIPLVGYYLIAWVLYGPVVLLETPMLQHPLRRSRGLVRGAWWRVCGTILAIGVVIVAVETIYAIGYMVILALLDFEDGIPMQKILSMIADTFESDYNKQLSPSLAISSLVSSCLTAFTAPIYAISVMLLYVNRRAQVE
ncbi:hypothetical protein F4X73_10205 [Candidatus Poribacteria bacterium]|nr:hypothetical protein [Candidatus Poribacteria bacterium]MYB65051.1 hypothetical protein [Candidatus Poribacteria bacterium]MYF55803.1 hypothetical protein [Candidatus Poribacteria bacterium]